MGGERFRLGPEAERPGPRQAQGSPTGLLGPICVKLFTAAAPAQAGAAN